jgi:hypothetical protein
VWLGLGLGLHQAICEDAVVAVEIALPVEDEDLGCGRWMRHSIQEVEDVSLALEVEDPGCLRWMAMRFWKP